MLKLDNICKTFNPGTINEKKALQNLSLTLKPGDFVTVIGGNGAGKSTMLNAIAGVWPVDSGSITIDGINVTGECEHKRAAYIGQTDTVTFGVSVCSLPALSGINFFLARVPAMAT